MRAPLKLTGEVIERLKGGAKIIESSDWLKDVSHSRTVLSKLDRTATTSPVLERLSRGAAKNPNRIARGLERKLAKNFPDLSLNRAPEPVMAAFTDGLGSITITDKVLSNVTRREGEALLLHEVGHNVSDFAKPQGAKGMRDAYGNSVFRNHAMEHSADLFAAQVQGGGNSMARGLDILDPGALASYSHPATESRKLALLSGMTPEQIHRNAALEAQIKKTKAYRETDSYVKSKIAKFAEENPDDKFTLSMSPDSIFGRDEADALNLVRRRRFNRSLRSMRANLIDDGVTSKREIAAELKGGNVHKMGTAFGSSPEEMERAGSAINSLANNHEIAVRPRRGRASEAFLRARGGNTRMAQALLTNDPKTLQAAALQHLLVPGT